MKFYVVLQCRLQGITATGLTEHFLFFQEMRRAPDVSTTKQILPVDVSQIKRPLPGYRKFKRMSRQGGRRGDIPDVRTERDRTPENQPTFDEPDKPVNMTSLGGMLFVRLSDRLLFQKK